MRLRQAPGWLAPAVACSLAAVSLAVCLPLLLGGSDGDREVFAADRGCPDVARGLDGLGEVRGCRVLDRDLPWWRADLVRITLLLDTDAGLAAVRIDYARPGSGRQYAAFAVERASWAVARWLGASERERLAADIEARGGVRPGDWPIYGGDG